MCIVTAECIFPTFMCVCVWEERVEGVSCTFDLLRYARLCAICSFLSCICAHTYIWYVCMYVHFYILLLLIFLYALLCHLVKWNVTTFLCDILSSAIFILFSCCCCLLHSLLYLVLLLLFFVWALSFLCFSFWLIFCNVTFFSKCNQFSFIFLLTLFYAQFLSLVLSLLL